MSEIANVGINKQHNNSGNSFKTIAGVTAGIGSSALLYNTISKRSDNYFTKKFFEVNNNVNSDVIRSSLNSTLKKSGMKDKHVKIIDFARYDLNKSPRNYDIKSLKEFVVKFPKIISNEMKHNMISSAQNGFNSFYVSGKYNKILINTNKLPLTGFHEIGHSINANNSKFWNGVAKFGGRLKLAPLIIAGIAIATRNKPEGEEPEGIKDSTTSFIKNNAGLLTLASFTPMLAEELKASQNGNKLAKEFLSPDLAKKVLKSNKYGAASYIVLALATSLAVSVGSKVRDMID